METLTVEQSARPASETATKIIEMITCLSNDVLQWKVRYERFEVERDYSEAMIAAAEAASGAAAVKALIELWEYVTQRQWVYPDEVEVDLKEES